MASAALGFRRKTSRRWVAVAIVLTAALAGCEAAGTERVVGRPSASPSATSTPLEQLKQLDLGRAGTILAEREGRAVAEPAEFDTDGSYAFRAVCTGGGKMTVRTHASKEHDVSIECKGYPSGMRYLNDVDVEVWSVHATDDQEWSIVWVDWDDEA